LNLDQVFGNKFQAAKHLRAHGWERYVSVLPKKEQAKANFFFLEYARELCIIALRRRAKHLEDTTHPLHTRTYDIRAREKKTEHPQTKTLPNKHTMM
jgi:hypothetical protein